MSSPIIYIVVPVFNEARVIGPVVQALRRIYEHVVVVDDASRDGSAIRAREAGAKVLRHAINRGQGASLQTGIDYALVHGAGIIVTFDGDGQHCVEDIANLVKPIIDGEADVVLGSRFLEPGNEIPIGRRMLLRFALIFTRVMSGMSVTDTHNGLRAFSARAARLVRISLDRMAHASELIDQIHVLRLKCVERPVRIIYTAYSLEKGQKTSGALAIIWDYLMGKLV